MSRLELHWEEPNTINNINNQLTGWRSHLLGIWPSLLSDISILLRPSIFLVYPGATVLVYFSRFGGQQTILIATPHVEFPRWASTPDHPCLNLQMCRNVPPSYQLPNFYQPSTNCVSYTVILFREISYLTPNSQPSNLLIRVIWSPSTDHRNTWRQPNVDYC